jgi:hypothetical protein
MAGVGTTVIKGLLQIQGGANTMTFSRNVVSYNLTQWQYGNVYGSSGATFLNWNNATFQADPNAQNQCFCAASNSFRAVFRNLGLITKSTYAAYRSYFTLAFEHVGADAVLRSSAGVLALAGSSTSATSLYEAAAGGQISFDGSANTDRHTLMPTCRLTGSGNFKFTGGVSDVYADYQSTNDPLVDGGVVNFREGTRYTSFGPTLRVSAGVANFEVVPAIFPPIALTGGTLDLKNWNVTLPSGAQSAGVLQGSGRATVAGTYSCTSHYLYL